MDGRPTPSSEEVRDMWLAHHDRALAELRQMLTMVLLLLITVLAVGTVVLAQKKGGPGDGLR